MNKLLTRKSVCKVSGEILSHEGRSSGNIPNNALEGLTVLCGC